MTQSDKEQTPRDGRITSEQVQDLPAKPVDAAETDQVKGGLEPVNTGKLGAKTPLGVTPIND
jgi:hypothetical protein